MMEPGVSTLLEPLSAHPHRAALQKLVRDAAIDATLGRRSDFASRHRFGSGPAVGPGHIPEGLGHDDAQTPYGNVLDVLDRGVELPEERALLGALLALSLETEPPETPEAAAELGVRLVWLAANTPCDALGTLDGVLGADAADVWRGVARVLLDPDAAPPDYGPSEALTSAAALRRSLSPEARALRFEAAKRIGDPALHALLAPTPEDVGGELVGEIQPAPRGPVLTTLMAVTLVLFVLGAGRLVGRYALGYKRPAALRLGPSGLELSQRIELLGRVLRERVTIVPLANLSRVTREVRYARAGLYVGLAALALGTYFGTGLFVDAVRVPGGSAPLIGLALLFVVLGLAVDFVLSSAADSARGRCRVVVVPVKGRVLCVGAVDPERADALLAAVAEQTRGDGDQGGDKGTGTGAPEPPPSPPEAAREPEPEAAQA